LLVAGVSVHAEILERLPAVFTENTLRRSESLNGKHISVKFLDVVVWSVAVTDTYSAGISMLTEA
jgi:hypothetical protein